MRTFDKKDVFSWANCEEAKKYIVKEGFIGNILGEINENVKRGGTVTLQDVEDEAVDCFYCEMGIFKDYSAGLFLPLDKVKEVKEEKKWRAFKNFDEFTNVTKKGIGDLINYKLKNSPDFYCAVITKIFCSLRLEPTIDFGNSCFKYTELFNDFVWLDSENTWKPFGIQE